MGRAKTDTTNNVTRSNLFEIEHSYSTVTPRTQTERLINLVPKATLPSIYSLADLKKSDWKELNDFRNQLRDDFSNSLFKPSPARNPQDDEIRIVVADIHGNYRNLYRLLLSVGAINRDGSRNEGYWICQVGDLIHGGEDVFQADADTSLVANQWVDCQLIGNHDLSFLTDKINSTFVGRHDQLAPELQSRLNLGFYCEQWKAVTAVDGYLISHAGANPNMLDKADISFDSSEIGVEALADLLEKAFINRVSGQTEFAPIIDAIGTNRGGTEPTGGIFWAGWPELLKAYQESSQDIKQIVGHTPQQNGPAHTENCWNIDLAGIEEMSGSVACLIKPPKKTVSDWKPVVLERAARPDVIR